MTVDSGDPVDDLSRAIDQTGAVIAATRPDQATLPTPCRSWDVRTLVGHVVRDVEQFTATASGEAWMPNDDDDAIGDDWSSAYRSAGDALLAAWRRAGVVGRTIERPFGTLPATWFVGQQIADLVVHAWDIAMATAQPTEFDQDLGERSLEWATQNLRPEYRGDEASGRAFGPEVPVPEDAGAHDRLVGFFGRDPGWAP